MGPREDRRPSPYHILTILAAPYGSDLYHQCVALREEILRKPLGLTLSDEELADDSQRWHFCALSEGHVIGCVSLKTLDERALQLKQMAVAATQQGAHVGARLLQYAEAWARQEGFRLIVLHARIGAKGFYAKFGYSAEGEPFNENTILHLKMTKRLA
jgi:N-acetylglutamate synthase-like GNAT family acetyltransferase